MTLLYRLNKLFKADMHAVVDQLEEPLPLLKQSIREMEDIITELEKQRKQLQNTEKQLYEQQLQLTMSIEKTNEELDICFLSDNDDLAKNLVKRKLEHLALQKGLEVQQNNNTTQLNDLKKSIDEKLPILQSLKQKLELFSTDDSQNHEHTPSSISISDTDVEVAFLREKQQRQSRGEL